MTGLDKYMDKVMETLEAVQKTQRDSMELAALMMADAVSDGNSIFAFGCNHAGLVTQELYYRAAGMALVNPIKAPGLCLDVSPATMTSSMERIPEYGSIIIRNSHVKRGDVVIIHSVSGRNAVPIDAAITCHELGAQVIALTNTKYSLNQPSRHTSGKRLMDVCDLVLDNCGEVGDGCVDLPEVMEKVGPTSTAVGAAIMNAVMVRCVEIIANRGMVPPVFLSANLEGGDQHNSRMLDEYHNRIYYM